MRTQSERIEKQQRQWRAVKRHRKISAMTLDQRMMTLARTIDSVLYPVGRSFILLAPELGDHPGGKFAFVSSHTVVNAKQLMVEFLINAKNE